jgi:hypothetical protein
VAFDTFAPLLVEISLLSHFSPQSILPERYRGRGRDRGEGGKNREKRWVREERRMSEEKESSG